MIMWNLLCYSAIFLSKVTHAHDADLLESDEDIRRPIWNVAHMVNDLYIVEYYLDQGANSLEFDVSFDWEGNAKYTFHGYPCDCFRSCTRYEDFETYLHYMRMLTTPGNNNYREELVLLFMDLKLGSLSTAAKIHAGEDIAIKLLDHYWMRGSSGATANILISFSSINHMEFVNSLLQKLKDENFTHYATKLGFDISGNEDIDVIRSAFEVVNITNQIWQGDGITNCLPRGISRLKEALRQRDELTFIDKVYWWTVDRKSTMRTTLRLGVDAMITNYPHRLVSVLKEEEFSNKFRLATYEDNPWTKHIPQSGSLMFQEFSGNFATKDYKKDEELLYNC